MNILHPRMTPARLEYLQAVERHGIYAPRHRRAANNCLHLCWTESVLRMPEGSIVRCEDREPGSSWDGVEWIGQQLTDECDRLQAERTDGAG